MFCTDYPSVIPLSVIYIYLNTDEEEKPEEEKAE